MKRALLIIGIVLVGFLALWPGPYQRHFSEPLPSSARLLHYERRQAGFDVSYAFLFEVSNDALLDQLVQAWDVTPSVEDDQNPMSFITLDPPAWWPARQLNQLAVQFERVDENSERYWSVWADREKGRLYAEYGRW